MKNKRGDQVSKSMKRINKASKAMTKLDDFWWDALESHSILPAWAAMRATSEPEHWDAGVCDAIAIAAVRAVREQLNHWSKE